MKFEIEFDDVDMPLVENYMERMELKPTDMSKLARRAILEKIFDDDACLSAYDEAIAEYKDDPTVYSFNEIRKMFPAA